MKAVRVVIAGCAVAGLTFGLAACGSDKSSTTDDKMMSTTTTTADSMMMSTTTVPDAMNK